MNAAETFETDGVEWTRYHYGESDDLFQRPCSTGCDNGLLYAPLRNCPTCFGDGFFVTAIDPRLGPLELMDAWVDDDGRASEEGQDDDDVTDFGVEVRFPGLAGDEPLTELWVCCEYCAWAEQLRNFPSPAEIAMTARAHRCGGQDEARK